jgi:hypothetical protein
MIMFLQVNRVYERDDSIFRLLELNDKQCVLMDVKSNKSIPTFHDRAMLEKEFCEDKIALLDPKDDPWWEHQHREYPESHEHLEKRDFNLERISTIINHNECFDSKVRGKLVALLELEGKGSRSTLYRYCRRYWQRGMCPNALLPDFPSCGAIGKKKTRGHIPLGRRPSIDPTICEGLSPEIKKLMSSALNATKFSGKYKSLAKGKKKNIFFVKHAYQDFALRYCKGDPSKVDKGLPSKASFKGYYYNEHTTEQIERANDGDKNFNANKRALNATIRSNGGYPGKAYIIDSTPIDVGVANEERLPHGRPTFYACIDEFTSACAGFWLVLTPPSYINVVHCLKMAMEGKVEFCNKLGVFVDLRDFPFLGKPEEVFADLGSDFKTKNLNPLIKVHNVAVKHSGAGQPDKRPSVEKFFDRLHNEILHKVPGVVSEYSSKKSGGQDSRDSYSLLLSELYEVIIDAVVTLNNTPLSDFDDDGDYPYGRSTTPIDIWNWGIPHRGKSLPHIDGDQFFFSMLKREEATRCLNVLKIDGIRFTCPKFSGIRRKNRNGDEIYQIVRDPMDASQIWLVPGEGESKYIECEIHTLDRRNKGKAWVDAVSYETARKTANAMQERKNLKKLVSKDPEQQAMIKNAELENKQSGKGKTKKERLGGLGDKESQRTTSQFIYGMFTPDSTSEYVWSGNEQVMEQAVLNIAQDANVNSARSQRFMK